MYKNYGKRIFDIICALLAMIVFSWLYVIVFVLVRIFLGTPAIFKQKRPGLDGKIFTLYKFRTMTDKRDENGKLLPDKVRLTTFGKLLRKLSLDELPEAVNILKGDMSVVGPRPLAVKYIPYYNEYENQRHSVRPGLTGLAQINGRNAINWEQRFEYDVTYVKNITFWGDINIIFKTVLKAAKGSDIAVRGTGGVVDFDDYRKAQLESGENPNLVGKV